MKVNNIFIVAAITTAFCSSAMAAVSAEEAKQLGTTLTPWGAIKAGNKDGTIPAYDGGLKSVAGYKPGSGSYVNPFEAEKPLYVIDAKNLDKYADKLPESTKAMFKRFPAAWHINVFPTHRVDWVSKSWEENSIKNATRAKLVDGGLGVADAFAGTPFPIPKNGNEVMWNAQLRPSPVSDRFQFQTYLSDSTGRTSMLGEWDAYFQCNYCDPKNEATYDGYYQKYHVIQTKPARSSGEQNVAWGSSNPVKNGNLAWTYLAGQRRVRLAPEFTYDTPSASYGGAIIYDEIGGFSGKMDRFTWKLVGLEEMIVPANGYGVQFPKKLPSGISGTPGMPDPDFIRYELRRVYLVEATRAPGARHIYAKRRFYIDADNWNHAQDEAYDDSGKLMRTILWGNAFLYDAGGYVGSQSSVIVDLIKGQYSVGVMMVTPALGGFGVLPSSTNRKEPVTAEYMSATGVR